MKTIIAILLCVFTLSANAKPVVEQQSVILLPLQVMDSTEATNQMQAAVVEGLEEKYTVYSGERVLQELKKVADIQNHSVKAHCDETRCLQDVAIKFQTENVAVAHVTKVDGGYLLSLSIVNVMTNESVFNNSITCEGCNVFKAIDAIKRLASDHSIFRNSVKPTEQHDVVEASSDLSDEQLWKKAEQSGAAEDYQYYLREYPQGEYGAWATMRLRNIQIAKGMLR